ncbi:MAG TPA: helix-turn-helix domain-containing protein [Actinomycetes bacterium]|nr:helix-turn-helix domain-containing protein [Actinomycetes bacterium]
MHADTGRRYRAYPTPEQAGRLTSWGHSCRAVWNLALEQPVRLASAWSHRPVGRAVPPPHRRPRGPAMAGRPARPERPAGAPPARPRL